MLVRYEMVPAVGGICRRENFAALSCLFENIVARLFFVGTKNPEGWPTYYSYIFSFSRQNYKISPDFLVALALTDAQNEEK